MLRISNIKIDVYKNQEKILQNEIEKILHVKTQEIKSYKIVKQSIDARKKDKICFIYQVDVDVIGNEAKILKNCDKRVSIADIKEYVLPQCGEIKLEHRPIVVGAGPAGLFAALMLAQMGYKPLLLERGQDVDTRTKDVRKFWEEGILNTESNVQFGEGGAGAFSDGKLTTGISDIRCQKVLKELVKHGAPEDILYSFRPHIGTDVLKKVVKNIRFHIMALGGEVCFGAKVTQLLLEDNAIKGVDKMWIRVRKMSENFGKRVS